VVAAVLGDVGVEVPQVMLALHALDGGALLVPDLGDVEEDVSGFQPICSVWCGSNR
jgi:aminoglycoside/choline kinase family phosphotransferase